MPKTNIYHSAIAADAALNGLGREITDGEMDACEEVVLDAYGHLPTSLDHTAEKMDTVLAIEDVEPVIRVALEATRDGSRRMADGLEMVRDALDALGRDPTNDEAKACAATILNAYRSFPDLHEVIVAFGDAVLTIEGAALKSSTRIVLNAIREGANQLCALAGESGVYAQTSTSRGTRVDYERRAMTVITEKSY